VISRVTNYLRPLFVACCTSIQHGYSRQNRAGLEIVLFMIIGIRKYRCI